MKKLTIAALLTTAAAGTFALAAFADHHRGGGMHSGQGAMMLEQLDTNGDGNITTAEVEASKAARFVEADANGDGAVTFAEFEAHAAAEKAQREADRRQRMFERLDADGNGTLSATEIAEHRAARGKTMFERMDTDADGVITQTEREAAKAKMRNGQGKRGDRRGQPE